MLKSNLRIKTSRPIPEDGNLTFINKPVKEEVLVDLYDRGVDEVYLVSEGGHLEQWYAINEMVDISGTGRFKAESEAVMIIDSCSWFIIQRPDVDEPAKDWAKQTGYPTVKVLCKPKGCKEGEWQSGPVPQRYTIGDKITKVPPGTRSFEREVAQKAADAFNMAPEGKGSGFRFEVIHQRDLIFNGLPVQQFTTAEGMAVALEATINRKDVKESVAELWTTFRNMTAENSKDELKAKLASYAVIASGIIIEYADQMEYLELSQMASIANFNKAIEFGIDFDSFLEYEDLSPHWREASNDINYPHVQPMAGNPGYYWYWMFEFNRDNLLSGLFMLRIVDDLGAEYTYNTAGELNIRLGENV